MFPLKLISKYILCCGAFLFLGLASSHLWAQSSNIPVFEIKERSGSTASVIKRLEKESGWVVSYSSRLCHQDSITLTSGVHSLVDFLEQVFYNCPITYDIHDKRIIVRPLEEKRQFFTISGFVRDSLSGETLPASNVYETTLRRGGVSNNYGFFSITLPSGWVNVTATYVGYGRGVESFNLTRDTIIHFSLRTNVQLEEVSVFSDHILPGISAKMFGANILPMEDVRQTPILFGESDLVKNIQLLPGVQGGSEGFSGLYVRGGGPDQNLILLDDVPVYNIGHLLGFYSIFNVDAVKHVTVHKSGFPARYSGRLSSVVDIRMIDGNKEKVKGTLNIGLLSSSLSLNGPLKKEKAGFAISFRRTYLDPIAGLIQKKQKETSNYYFYDINAKFNYDFNYRNRIYMSFYFGRDKYFTTYNSQEINYEGSDGSFYKAAVNDKNEAGWGNLVGALRWNSIWSDKLFSNVTATYSDYRFFIGIERNDRINLDEEFYEQRYLSGIKDYSAKIDFDYYPSNQHSVKFGGGYIVHLFNPGIDIVRREFQSATPADTSIGKERMLGGEMHLYVEDEFSPHKDVRINVGLSSALFNGRTKLYSTLEPRLSVFYKPWERWGMRTSYSLMSQYLHTISSSNIALPTDLWLPVTDKIAPMKSSQISLGTVFTPGESGDYSFSLDGYLKRQSNLLHYKESTGFFDYSTNWEDKLTVGEGFSYGAELYLQKLQGNWRGWFSYTYAKTSNRFSDLNGGKSFPTRFDRPHDIKISYSYLFNKRTIATIMWQYGSGLPVTLPIEKYYAPDIHNGSSELSYSEDFGRYNEYRMPSFHRLDIGVSFHKQRSKTERVWDVGVINAYGRQNPFMLYFSSSNSDEPSSSQRSLKQLSILPIPVPYIKYTLKF